MTDIKLVKMTRSLEEANGGPTEADVHPDEVSSFALGGWVAAGEVSPARLNVKDTVEKLKLAPTVEEFDAILVGEDRDSVLKAAVNLRKKFER